MNIVKRELSVAWFFLIAATVSEVSGTGFLKMENQVLGYTFMTLFIAFSYFFMGKTTRKVQVGIVYAVWELLGIILIFLVSFIVFKESLALAQVLGVILSIVGIIMINIGEVKG